MNVLTDNYQINHQQFLELLFILYITMYIIGMCILCFCCCYCCCCWGGGGGGGGGWGGGPHMAIKLTDRKGVPFQLWCKPINLISLCQLSHCL